MLGAWHASKHKSVPLPREAMHQQNKKKRRTRPMFPGGRRKADGFSTWI